MFEELPIPSNIVNFFVSIIFVVFLRDFRERILFPAKQDFLIIYISKLVEPHLANISIFYSYKKIAPNVVPHLLDVRITPVVARLDRRRFNIFFLLGIFPLVPGHICFRTVGLAC